jgi:hypothetical protein
MCEAKGPALHFKSQVLCPPHHIFLKRLKREPTVKHPFNE